MHRTAADPCDARNTGPVADDPGPRLRRSFLSKPSSRVHKGHGDQPQRCYRRPGGIHVPEIEGYDIASSIRPLRVPTPVRREQRLSENSIHAFATARGAPVGHQGPHLEPSRACLSAGGRILRWRITRGALPRVDHRRRHGARLWGSCGWSLPRTFGPRWQRLDARSCPPSVPPRPEPRRRPCFRTPDSRRDHRPEAGSLARVLGNELGDPAIAAGRPAAGTSHHFRPTRQSDYCNPSPRNHRAAQSHCLLGYRSGDRSCFDHCRPHGPRGCWCHSDTTSPSRETTFSPFRRSWN